MGPQTPDQVGSQAGPPHRTGGGGDGPRARPTPPPPNRERQRPAPSGSEPPPQSATPPGPTKGREAHASPNAGSALGVLEPLAGAGLAVLLALLLAVVAGQEPGALQGGAALRVGEDEG